MWLQFMAHHLVMAIPVPFAIISWGLHIPQFVKAVFKMQCPKENCASISIWQMLKVVGLLLSENCHYYVACICPVKHVASATVGFCFYRKFSSRILIYDINLFQLYDTGNNLAQHSLDYTLCCFTLNQQLWSRDPLALLCICLSVVSHSDNLIKIFF